MEIKPAPFFSAWRRVCPIPLSEATGTQPHTDKSWTGFGAWSSLWNLAHRTSTCSLLWGSRTRHRWGWLLCSWTPWEHNTVCVLLPDSSQSIKLLLDFICSSHPSASYFLLQPSSFSKQLQWCHCSFKSKPWLFELSCSSGNSCNCFILMERWFNACFHNQYKWKPHYTLKLWQVCNYLDCYFKDLPWYPTLFLT